MSSPEQLPARESDAGPEPDPEIDPREGYPAWYDDGRDNWWEDE